MLFQHYRRVSHGYPIRVKMLDRHLKCFLNHQNLLNDFHRFFFCKQTKSNKYIRIKQQEKKERTKKVIIFYSQKFVSDVDGARDDSVGDGIVFLAGAG